MVRKKVEVKTPEELVGKTIKSLEIFPKDAWYGQTWAIVFEDGTRTLIEGKICRNDTAVIVEEMRDAPLFFEPDDFGDQIRLEEEERREQLREQEERERKRYEELKKKFGVDK